MWKLTGFFAALLACGLVFADHNEDHDFKDCEHFRVSPGPPSGEPNVENFYVGLTENDKLEDGKQVFTMVLKHSRGTKITSNSAIQKDVEYGHYQFHLTDEAIKALAKPRALPLMRYVRIIMRIEYAPPSDSDDPPVFTVFKTGSSACYVKRESCTPYPKLPRICPVGIAGIIDNGFQLQMQVARFPWFHLKIGFDDPELNIEDIEFVKRNSVSVRNLKKKSSDGNCTQVAHFTGRMRVKPGVQRNGIVLNFKTGKRNHLPNIVFVSYGNANCKTSCGVNPCTGEGPKPTFPAITKAPTTRPASTKAPTTRPASTKAPTTRPASTKPPTQPPVVTTEAPTQPPVVTTEAPTQPPVVTTEAPTQPPFETTEAPTQPPVETTEAPTEPPAVTTEEPTQPPVVTESPTESPTVATDAPTEPPAADDSVAIVNQLADVLSADDFAEIESDFWK